MNNYNISAFAISNVGKRRANNEDNFYLNHRKVASQNEAFSSFEGNSIYCSVCDGMGGESAGEVASLIAVDTVEKYEPVVLGNPSERNIEALVQEANDKICKEIQLRKKRIGTTFTLLCINNESAVVSNIGDSRVYRFSQGKLEQISRDHTEAQTMVDSGIVTKEESMKLKEKHRLTQHLGIFPSEMIIEPHNVKVEVNDNDCFLLCSDGLTDMVTEPEIEAVLASGRDAKSTAEILVGKALENGGRDNVTVIVCKVKSNKPPKINGVVPEVETKANKKEKKSSAGKTFVIALLCFLIALVAGFFVGKLYSDKESGKEITKYSETVAVLESEKESYSSENEAVQSEKASLQSEAQSLRDEISSIQAETTTTKKAEKTTAAEEEETTKKSSKKDNTTKADEKTTAETSKKSED